MARNKSDKTDESRVPVRCLRVHPHSMEPLPHFLLLLGKVIKPLLHRQAGLPVNPGF